QIGKIGLVAQSLARSEVAIPRVIDPVADVTVQFVRAYIVVDFAPPARRMDAPERGRVYVLQNPPAVSAERLSHVDFALDTETVGDRPAQIRAKSPDACDHLRLSRNRGSDLADDAGDTDLKWSPGVLSFAHSRSQCKGGACLHVGPAV